MIPDIRIQDYSYDLPEERIAKYPLEQRDASKLLVCTEGTGFTPQEAIFSQIDGFLPQGALMIFNETKVVPARLFFRRTSGALIEIFCLEPAEPADYQLCFASTVRCRWKAIVGNRKKWKGDTLALAADPEAHPIAASYQLKADLIEVEGNSCIVEFSWSGGASFSQVLACCGNIPIPPYLKRETEALDLERYQTVYALMEGSVAAPTAGLHFTDAELQRIDEVGIRRRTVCLHVGAGTFLPVKAERIADHQMHTEPFEVSASLLRELRDQIAAGRPVVTVGTTSTRCLESLYYLGVQCIEKGAPEAVRQWEPYRDEGYLPTTVEALDALIDFLSVRGEDRLVSRTGIIIVPGFKFRVADFLVTNFHQPQSTLLLLLAAFVGQTWHDLYSFAMEHGFRFLSYGDSSLLQRNNNQQI